MSSSTRRLLTAFVIIMVLVAVCTVIAVVLLWKTVNAPGSSLQLSTGRAGSATGAATSAGRAMPSGPTDANDPAGLPACTRRLQVLSKAHFTIGYDPGAARACLGVLRPRGPHPQPRT